MGQFSELSPLIAALSAEQQPQLPVAIGGITATSARPMSAQQTLSGKQLRHLRALAHPLKPIVQLGKNGWTDAVAAQLDRALLDHELIKVRLGGESPTEMDEFTKNATSAVSAHLVQVIGSIAVLYRRHPDKPKIVLPRGK